MKTTKSRDLILQLVLLGLSLVAWIFACVSTFHCTFATVENADVGVGFFSFRSFSNGEAEGCARLTNEGIGTAGRFARLFASLLFILLTTYLLLVAWIFFFAPKGVPRDVFWWITRVAISICSVCNYLQFTIFAELKNNTGNFVEFKLGGSGIIAVLNGILLICLTGLAFYTKSSPEPFFVVNPAFETEVDSKAVNGLVAEPKNTGEIAEATEVVLESPEPEP